MTLTSERQTHLVIHTHWDREWYLPAGRFRQRLIELVDELIEDTGLSAERSFLLDGQAIVLHDYLSVRPARAERLAALLRSGALEAGPWFVLADELIPSGEALVRNLLAGVRLVRGLGGTPPPVLYSPDAFGHPAALPTLARGFGFPLAIVWRGLGGVRWPAGDTFRWRAADGSEVIVHHLPPDGYEFGASIPLTDDVLAEWWTSRQRILRDRTRTGITLLPSGADHHARQRGLEAAVERLRAIAGEDGLCRSSLREFAGALVAVAGAEIPVIAGELRDSTGYTWSLQGTFGVRARLKRGNAIAERTLLRDAEPWSALVAFTLGRKRAHLVRTAWQRLLECHPHDTLCGCSIDAVARAMAARLEDALAQARGIREDALLDLLGHDRERARTQRDAWRPVLVVRNRAARRRSGVARVELLRFLSDVPVGRGSSSGIHRRTAPSGASSTVPGLPMQVLGTTRRHDRIDSPRHYPDMDLVEATAALVWIDGAPGYGAVTHQVEAGPPSSEALPPDVTPATAHDGVLSNGLVTADLRDGTLRLLRGDGHGPTIRVGFEDVGDAGDLYTHSPVEPFIVERRFVGVTFAESGPLRAAARLRYLLLLPGWTSRAGRHSGVTSMPLELRVSVTAGEPFVRLDLLGINRARDHRLRLLLSTGLTGDIVYADAAFGRVMRARAAPPSDADERPPATAPLARHVTIDGSGGAVTLFADGLAEYEATPAGDLAVTLVRAVGELSRDDLPERPGHAGWPAHTPGAQEPGPLRARLAVLIDRSDENDRVMRIEHAAEDFLLPLVGGTLRSAFDDYPGFTGFELIGDGLAFGACKEVEEGGGILLRCVNLLDRPGEGVWRLPTEARGAWMARLDETRGRSVEPEGRLLRFEAPPFGVVSMIVE